MENYFELHTQNIALFCKTTHFIMKIRKKFVVIFQSDVSTNDSKYVDVLKQEGIHAENISPISFNFINQEKLQGCLNDADEYSGIIFTSTKAVSAVASVFTSKSVTLENWRQKENFSVGKATTMLALSAMNLETYGSESGNSENLCQFIVEKCQQYEKPFLYPCSNIRKDTIPIILSKHNIKIEEVICYETIPNDQFKQIWERLISKEGLPEILVFFSPSGVQNCSKIVINSYQSAVQPKFIALGPSTEKAFNVMNIMSCKVAEKPNPESVLSTVKSLLD